MMQFIISKVSFFKIINSCRNKLLLFVLGCKWVGKVLTVTRIHICLAQLQMENHHLCFLLNLSFVDFIPETYLSRKEEVQSQGYHLPSLNHLHFILDLVLWIFKTNTIIIIIRMLIWNFNQPISYTYLIYALYRNVVPLINYQYLPITPVQTEPSFGI